MIKDFIKIIQDGFTMYSVSLSINELIENTIVEYYDPATEEGYQRQLNSSHYKKIAKYLEENINPILPTSILTAVYPKQIREQEKIHVEGNLRVVDGQHRIEGIKYLRDSGKDTFNKICDYKFSTLIMVIPEGKRIYEIESFININKTSKPVKTDLAVQLMNKIRKSDIKKLMEDPKISISTKISKKLNFNIESIWYNSIKLDDKSTRGRTISINAFHKSLFGIVDNYLKNKHDKIDNLEKYHLSIDELTKFIEDAWNIVANKWEKCFNDNYKLNYNIKKGIGVYPLHQILSEILDKSNGKITEALIEFKDIINASNVKDEDWIVGGKFSSHNSKTGFKYIGECIRNKKMV